MFEKMELLKIVNQPIKYDFDDLVHLTIHDAVLHAYSNNFENKEDVLARNQMKNQE
jgi:hypothetical protein